jgi:hypothetical protein
MSDSPRCPQPPGQAQAPVPFQRNLRDVATFGVQGPTDGFHRDGAGRRRRHGLRSGAGVRPRQCQLGLVEEIVRQMRPRDRRLRPGHHRSGPQHMVELSYVAGPGIACEQVRHFGGQVVQPIVALPLQNAPHQRHQVGPLAQRGQPHRQAIKPVVKVLAEGLPVDHLAQIPVRGTDDGQVDGQCTRAAQWRDLPLLEHPQQVRLQWQRHVADLIEEQGAAVGLNDLSR